jgi:hypothetical protein
MIVRSLSERKGSFFVTTCFFAEKRGKKAKSGLPLSAGIASLDSTLKFGGSDGN